MYGGAIDQVLAGGGGGGVETEESVFDWKDGSVLS